jgi:STE24 endopeptidase
MTATTLFYIIIGILLIEFAVDALLDFLNARKFDDPVPPELENLFDPEEYRKSQSYKKVNFRFGLLSSGSSFLLILVFLIFGGFGWVDGITASISKDPVL